MLWIKVYITQYSDFQLFLVWKFNYLFVLIFFNWAVRLCVRDDNYGWAVVEKSTNHCVVRWMLNSFDFYLLSYIIIDMYIQRLRMYLFIISFGNKIIGKSNKATPLSIKTYAILTWIILRPLSALSRDKRESNITTGLFELMPFRDG